jgi:predicted nucleic acid-binding Zn ribbon protein
MTTSKEKRKCPVCGNPVTGRADKKFCTDECRNEFHNQRRVPANEFMLKVNKILKRNRDLLAALNPEGKTRLPREKLLSSGFRFDFHTSQYTTSNGNTYIFCYDQGYCDLGQGHLVLVQRQAYMDKL